MGAQDSTQANFCDLLASVCFLVPHSYVASNEGHEGNEGRRCEEGWPQGHDGSSGVQLRGLHHWLEVERREGRHGGLLVRRSRAVEEERVLHVRGCVEFEVEEESRDASSQGHQSVHQRALRLQGKPASKTVRALALKKFKD